MKCALAPWLALLITLPGACVSEPTPWAPDGGDTAIPVVDIWLADGAIEASPGDSLVDSETVAVPDSSGAEVAEVGGVDMEVAPEDGVVSPCGPSCGALEECLEYDGTNRCLGEMVEVPAGSFWMGCNEAVDPWCKCPGEECDYHEVEVPGFDIDATEVTNQRYADFLNWLESEGKSNKCTYDGAEFDCVDSSDAGSQTVVEDGVWGAVPGKEKFPVVEVSWYGAYAYCQWADKRLPSESEWEKAARGGCDQYVECAAESAVWPWGNSFPEKCDDLTAVYAGCNCKGKTCPVGTHPSGASPYQAHDLAGNVGEWVQDWYHAGYAGAPSDGGPWEMPETAERAVRGGGFDYSGVVFLRTSSRLQFAPSSSFGFIGFRCAK
jgi:eukaryotic-like serine/threonine-protein kinase